MKREKVNAEIYRLHDIPDLIARIAAIRDHGAAMRKYREELRIYNKKRRGRPEVEVTAKDEGDILSHRTRGFIVEHMGQKISIPRPHKPYPVRGWNRSSYSRDSFLGISHTTPAKDYGLLANGGKYNRSINPARVKEYADSMAAGKWRDLLSDPIAITSDGEVINGQHRLAAAGQIEWDGDEKDPNPRFLVLFDVPREEIWFMDTSKRTGRDLHKMAEKQGAS